MLPALVLAQLLGTSPWFAVNAVMPDLQREAGWPAAAVGPLTSALQLGFIAGTLVFAVFALADRGSARRVFVACALASSGCTLAAAAAADNGTALLGWRLLTGFFLAGIYPVGMKIASLWFPQGLGVALGWLLGALVLGSASPHALRALGGTQWLPVFQGVALASAAAAALMMVAIPEPPQPAAGAGNAAGLRMAALASLWREPRLRASVGGYFGHMWELYTLWVLMPALLGTRLAAPVAVSWATFLLLGSGALGCIGGGLAARRFGSARVAGAQLAVSGLCCLAAPWAITAGTGVFMGWLLAWGITVAGDSPQFSALTAACAPRGAVGSVLTLTNSIGFAISALSISLFSGLAQTQALATLLPWLGLGPLAGLLALRPLLRRA